MSSKQQQVWEEDFANKLHVRGTSQHKRCSECVKHQLIMKKLSDNQNALEQQAQLWGAHMDRQFEDRRCYWELRAQSRLGQSADGRAVISIILDGMDHAKWALPRSEALQAKTFNSFVRPHVSCTGIIVHGRYVAIALAEQYVQKGGNFTIELLLHTFHRLAQAGVDLRTAELNLQADNSSKEAKSNGVLRLLSLLVSRGRLGAARLHCLQSGHSHEDIDQFFPSLQLAQ